jgi:hypothetical protein
MLNPVRRCLFALLLPALLPVAGAQAHTAFTVPVPPWTFPGTERGVATEYLRYLFDTADVPLKLDSLPYIRVINGLRDGSNAAAVLIPDAERDTFALRLCQVTTIHSGILYKRARHGKLDLQHLSGLVIGMQRGTHALDRLNSVPGVRPYTIDSIDQGLKMLEKDRLDATFVSSPGSESMLAAAGLSRSDYGWLEVEAQPVVIYISRRAALGQDEAALQRLRAVCDGSGRAVMQRLVQHYR